jgi:hypothetical protein
MSKKIIAEQNPDGTYKVKIFEPYLKEETSLGLRVYSDLITTINRAMIHIDALADDNNDGEIFNLKIGG